MRTARMMTTAAVAMSAGLAVGAASAQVQDIAPITQTVVAYHQDSGVVSNAGAQPQVVSSMVVRQAGTSWMRLSFSDVQLSGNRDHGDGSYILITSMLDGAQHRLDSKSIREWSLTSAYMNGDTVIVDIVAYPGTGNNRLVISDVTIGAPATPESICGALDDRTLSTDPRGGRIMPTGCSGWMFDDANHCFLTAGHCMSSGEPGLVTQFNVPLSLAGGDPVNPPPEDQYPIDPASIQSNGGLGTGDDYAYYGCFANSNTGLTAFEAQGDSYVVAGGAPAPQVGDQIRITGYGSTTGTQGTPLSWNQVQKTHVGPYDSLSGTTVRYVTDTTGGNSGSPIIFEGTGQAIGIHTHGGCSASGGSNIGTNIEHAGLQAFLANPLGVCIPQGLKFTYPAGRPTLSNPSGGTTFNVVVGENAGHLPQPNTAVLHYNNGSGWMTTPIAQTIANQYIAAVPATDCGTQLMYYLSASDTNGVVHNDPPTAPNKFYTVLSANSVKQQIFVEESFQNGLPVGWSTTGLWHIGTMCSPGPACDGTTSFMYYGIDTGCSYLTGAASNGSLNLPAVDLSQAEGAISLEFCYNLETENNPFYDHAEVRVNGQMVVELGESAAWSSQSLDLSSFAGQIVNISFYFDTIDSVQNNFNGFQVDSVKVSANIADCSGCYADCDNSATLDFFDFLCFQNAFANQQSYADCDKNGSHDFFDFLCYQNAFAGGCP